MEKIISILNNRLADVRFSARVFVVGIILSATFFLLSIDSFKTYRADMHVLVSGKSEVGIGQQNQLIGNMIEFSQTLSFYDRMLKLNPDVRDISAGLAPDERKAVWNEMIAAEMASDNSSVLKISITADREIDAKQLAVKSTRTLFDTVAFYYDVKNDVDLRIIDGPISKSQVPFWYAYLIFSLSLGFSLATLLDRIPFAQVTGLKKGGELFKKSFFPEIKKDAELLIEQELETLNNLYDHEQAEQPFVFETKERHEEIAAPISNYDEKFEEVKKITKELEPSKYPNFPEMPIRGHQSENVPDNLPIAGDSFFFEDVSQPEQTVTEEVLSQAAETKKDVYSEPTEEELKRRLNSLLKGEF